MGLRDLDDLITRVRNKDLDRSVVPRTLSVPRYIKNLREVHLIRANSSPQELYNRHELHNYNRHQLRHSIAAVRARGWKIISVSFIPPCLSKTVLSRSSVQLLLVLPNCGLFHPAVYLQVFVPRDVPTSRARLSHNGSPHTSTARQTLKVGPPRKAIYSKQPRRQRADRKPLWKMEEVHVVDVDGVLYAIPMDVE